MCNQPQLPFKNDRHLTSLLYSKLRRDSQLSLNKRQSPHNGFHEAVYEPPVTSPMSSFPTHFAHCLPVQTEGFCSTCSRCPEFSSLDIDLSFKSLLKCICSVKSTLTTLFITNKLSLPAQTPYSIYPALGTLLPYLSSFKNVFI